jgi:hypothetical protein
MADVWRIDLLSSLEKGRLGGKESAVCDAVQERIPNTTSLCSRSCDIGAQKA